MLREELEDSVEILETILSQPLAVSEERTTTLIEAAKEFRREDALNSDLRKIVMNFIRYPEPTETMLRELQWLEDSLSLR